MPPIPNFSINAVDIRDVADLHIRAMITPEAKGQRFIASADGQISMPEIARLLKEKAPAVSERVSLKILPDFVLRIAELFNPKAKDSLYLSRLNRRISNDKAKTVLGWKPIANNEEAILASVENMVKFSMI
jgi:nucleoside-diphosphate-sugar epimerase